MIVTFEYIVNEAVRNELRYVVCYGCGFVKVFGKSGQEAKIRVSSSIESVKNTILTLTQ